MTASECAPCAQWLAGQLATGEWDDFTAKQVAQLLQVHHDAHLSPLDRLAELPDDAEVRLTAKELRLLLAPSDQAFFSGDVTERAEADEDDDEAVIARELQPDPPAPVYVPPPAPDGHEHIRHARQRCIPPEPGFVDEVCHCGTIVNPHVPCPHPKQQVDNGSVMCAVCDFVFVRKSGVVGDDGPGGIARHEATWMPDPGATNDGTATVLSHFKG